MPRGLDIMIAFVSSTAIIFNLSTYILPSSVNRAFSSLITVLPTYDGGPTFEFSFTGKCYADNVNVSCLESILAIARAASTGYEDIDTYRMGHRFYNLMKVVITTYTICKLHESKSGLFVSSRFIVIIMLFALGVRMG